LTLDFPLLCNEIVKIFEIQTIFSLYTDSDCFLMNILEEQKFDFSLNVFVNSLQFFNPLNIDESLYVFGRLFSFDTQGVRRQICVTFEQNVEFKMDVLMGTSSKLSESMFIFGFVNRCLLFDHLRVFDQRESFFNGLLNTAIRALEMKKYGYAAFFSKDDSPDNFQGDFFKRIFLKSLMTHGHKKMKNYSIFLALNLTCDLLKLNEFLADPMRLNSLEEFLITGLMTNIYEVFDQYKKENEFQVLMTLKEKKTLETFNNDLPRIAQCLESITQTLHANYVDLEEENHHNHLPSRFEINKKLWSKILFEK